MDAAILRLAAAGPIDVHDVERELAVSRATAQRLLKRLVDDGRLERTGAARATRYALAPVRRRWRLAGLAEDRAWKELAPSLASLAPLSSEGDKTLSYCVTEMINNAVDHSRGSFVEVTARRSGVELVLDIVDDGIGVFQNVVSAHGLDSLEDAVVQLEKGKLTSQPARHSGQGLFFTSKAASRFRLEADGLAWIVDNDAGDRAIAHLERSVRGTRVELTFHIDAIRRLEDVFPPWAMPGEGFATTRVTVKLAAHGAALISRSEAKRVVANLEKFEHVILDFAGVDAVGQGFVDEVFRVFARDHPSTTLEPIHMNVSVAFMVDAARSAPRSRSLARPVERALERLSLSPSARSPEDVLVLASTALVQGLRLSGTGGVARERLRDLFAEAAAVDIERAVSLTPAAIEMRAAELDVSFVTRVERLARIALERVSHDPELHRFFSDEAGIDAFWRLPPEQRRSVWGPPVAPLD